MTKKTTFETTPSPVPCPDNVSFIETTVIMTERKPFTVCEGNYSLGDRVDMYVRHCLDDGLTLSRVMVSIEPDDWTQMVGEHEAMTGPDK